MPVPPPPLQSRSSQQEGLSERPHTPNRTNFITPIATPQGSPSKKTHPPGAHDLPAAFESMKIGPGTFGSPTKQGRGTPLTTGQSNTQAVDESYFSTSSGHADDSVLHKTASTPGSPLRKQGKENTPPSRGNDAALNHAALSRQELYQTKEPQTTKKYNTQRGLTTEELAILNKPNVKRLANVTQLCK